MNFDYGDPAIAKTKDDTGRVTEQKCVIVGITPVDSEEKAKHFKCAVGALVYTVEFGDGTDALVLEADLQAPGLSAITCFTSLALFSLVCPTKAP